MGGLAAAAAAGLLVVGGIVLARGQDEPDAGVAVALLAVLYAGVAGLLLAPGELRWQWPLPGDFFGAPLAAAGAAMLLVGVVAVVGLREGRSLVIPAIVVGAMLAASGVLMQVSEFDPTVVFTVLMTLVVLAGSIFPWLALGVTSTKVDQIFSLHDITADPDDIDPQQVGADARVAHEILLAVSATVGTLLVLLAPLAVSRRRLRHHPGRGVLPGRHVPHPAVPRRLRGPGRPGLRHPRPLLGGVVDAADPRRLAAGAAIALAVVGAVLLVSTLVPASPSVRRGRIGDAVETATLLSLLPLMVVAAGFFDQIKG